MAIPANLASLSSWLRDAAWPLWLEHGIDWEAGGFHESLDPQSLSCTADCRRLRVAARQTYVFAQACHDGLEGADEALLLGLDFLAGVAAQKKGGYARQFDLQNRATDTSRDLYDHSFVLLALSSASGLVDHDVLYDQAVNLHDYMLDNFAHPNGGFVESLPPALPRRQNPHMHLLEACLSAVENFDDTSFMETADMLVSLFREKFLAGTNGVLPELYDDNWQPQKQLDGGFIFEPGHHCEWVWLLDWYQQHAGPSIDLQEISALLMHYADHSASKFGLPNEVYNDGRLHDANLRLWPQTERLKAEMLRGDKTPATIQRGLAGLADWLLPNGLWHERRAADGTPILGAIPASSLYHITCAILTAEQTLT
jgi:mannose-6-phosphate isomerase